MEPSSQTLADRTPLHDDGELTAAELQQLRDILIATREEIAARTRLRVSGAMEAAVHLPDESDEATNVTTQAFDLRLANKDRKLLNLIEHALDKMARNEYGVCEASGEPIDKRRLFLRPWVRYSVVEQDRLEKERRLMADN